MHHILSSSWIIPEKNCSEIYHLKHVKMQQVYMYFRGSGKEAEMKREAAHGAMRNAF